MIDAWNGCKRFTRCSPYEHCEEIAHSSRGLGPFGPRRILSSMPHQHTNVVTEKSLRYPREFVYAEESLTPTGFGQLPKSFFDNSIDMKRYLNEKKRLRDQSLLRLTPSVSLTATAGGFRLPNRLLLQHLLRGERRGRLNRLLGGRIKHFVQNNRFLTVRPHTHHRHGYAHHRRQTLDKLACGQRQLVVGSKLG